MDRQRLPGRPPRPAGRWCTPFPPDVEQASRDRDASSARLGVQPDVVYHWVQQGHLPGRRGDAGRLWITFTPAIEHACPQRMASSYKLPPEIKAQAEQRLESRMKRTCPLSAAGKDEFYVLHLFCRTPEQ
jgi:hypothetical protein